MEQPQIDRAQAQRSIDDYVAAWNMVDAPQRAEALARVMTPDAVYCDPSTRAEGIAAIARCIGQVQAAYPGGRIARTSRLDTHHLCGRFHWQLTWADGRSLPESLDVVEFAPDGRIRSVTGFFGPLAAAGG